MGNVCSANIGQAPARQAAINAGTYRNVLFRKKKTLSYKCVYKGNDFDFHMTSPHLTSY